MLRLLNLPDSVRERLREGVISAGHARAALAADDPEGVIDQVIQRKLSVRDTEKLVRKLAAGDLTAGGAAKQRSQPEEKDVDTEALEADLSRALGLNVEIKSTAKGGELKIQYRDLEQLDDICRRLSRQ
ncbi:MAG: hypothetical protein CMK06_13930 [Ponticaulis sp.]|nr:hypothetical protein [Ponticaulis sp.]